MLGIQYRNSVIPWLVLPSSEYNYAFNKPAVRIHVGGLHIFLDTKKLLQYIVLLTTLFKYWKKLSRSSIYFLMFFKTYGRTFGINRSLPLVWQARCVIIQFNSVIVHKLSLSGEKHSFFSLENLGFSRLMCNNSKNSLYCR